MERKFKVGDRVKLISDGTIMSVTKEMVERDIRVVFSGSTADDRYFGGNWQCTFNTPSGFKTHVFHQDELEKY